MIKLQPYSGLFSPVDSTIYELFRSKLYDGVWFAEKSQPDIFNISENFKTLLDYKPTDSVAWNDLISPQDLPGFTEQIQNISNTEYTSCTDIRFIHKNGNHLWMQTHIYSKSIPDQIQRYVFIAFKDITDQKNHELKVKRQQLRDNDILNGSGIGTWEYNLITEKVVFNESCAKIIGYTLKELNEKESNFWDNLTHPDDLKRTRHLINEHITQKSSGFKNEVRVKHKDGHWVWVMDIGKVLSYTEDGQPEWLGGIHYAITERKNGELLVQQYKDLLEDVNEAAEIGIWEVDLKTNQVNCSDEIKKIFGVPLFFDLKLDDVVGFMKEGKSRQKMIDSIKNALEEGENYNIEIEIITVDKKTLWCRAIGISEFNNGECTRYYGFFQNIHDKVIATKELALKEELFRKTFSHAAVGMAVIDLKGSISKVNKSLCNYLGYSNKQLLEKNFDQFSHPLDKDLSDKFIAELLLGKRESFQLDKRYIHKDGSILWGHISVSSVRNEMGRITYFVVQVQDITERKKNELLLINYKDLLERSNAVAKIGSWEIDVNNYNVSWSSSLNTILNTRKDFTPTFFEFIDYFIAEEHRKDAILTVKNALEKGMSFDIQILANANDSDPKWVRMIGISEFEDNHCKRLYGLIQDIDAIKKAQCEIIIKEEQWRTTFNHANVGMSLINFNGEAYKVNPSLSDMFGYTIKEMQSMRIKDISLEEDFEKNIEMMSKLMDGTIENFSQEMRFIHKNGNVIWANVSVSSVKNDFNRFTHMVAQLVDITESKTNEILLKKYKDLLERSNKVAKIGSWELNPENHMLYWSENLKRLLGNKEYKAHNFSDSIIDYVLEENHEKMAYLLNNAMQNGHSFDFELQLKTASGLRWMRMIGISNFKNGICKSVHGLVQDIEEFKSAELEILLREEEFRQTFWHAPIGMVLLDLNGKIARVNPGMCETLGYSEKEMLAINKSELSHPDDLEETNKLTQQLLSGELESFQQEKRYFHKNGNLIWTILSMSSVKNDKGQTTHFVCQVSNITREKLLTESLTEHNNRLQNYAHIVSHNLRSHTGNLSMLLELSEMNHKSGFEDELFEHIKSASNNMCETVNHLSEIVEIQNLIKNTLVPINLRKRVKKSLQNIRTAVSQVNGEVVLKVNKELVIYGISSYVDSVILNILTNAIKYKSPHRLLVIDIRATKIKGYMALSIADNGLGIDLEQHGAKIFGMYKTFHDHKNARGIGLFISKNQIEAMGGSIEVESQPNIGSTFTIYFKDEDN
ncbi:MAG: PAS domain S-box protein [Gelidibacter sp.]